ncbi:rpoD (nucleomorph) [Hemiselmis andersenii]|uniref:RpoD n=1 Tax=Hemiselmis andersenii TaxID=464988 RepID=A9BK56_HEMAN|nr:rpoD [Hemiselmis andersenii]ABW97889.1 rpoD [Hemiselmis andersenii]|mmetsp:Transcript_21728/g.50407  ORF Transcript_21728/g.50407 Transcript_21728/m.50407 type:complete len:486 (+) Transcript_21728:49-1506(+)
MIKKNQKILGFIPNFSNSIDFLIKPKLKHNSKSYTFGITDKKYIFQQSSRLFLKKFSFITMYSEKNFHLSINSIQAIPFKKTFQELTEGEMEEIIRSFGHQEEISSEIINDEDERDSKSQTVRGLQKADDSVRWYLQLIGRVRLLRPEEEIQLAREISQLLHWEHVKISLREKLQREPTSSEWTAACKVSDVKKFRAILHNARRAKERMVAANLRLVVSIAKRYVNRGMSLQDLIQEGSLGLIRAAEKFDSEKGFKFSTYATWWVKQAVTRAIADHSRTIRLPVHLYDTISAIRKTTRTLNIEIGRSPTEEEIAEKMDMSVEKLRSVLQSAQPTLSLERPLKNDDDASQLSDFIEADQESPEEHVEKSMLRDDLENVINSLSPRERDVVRMRYGLDDGRIKTLEEIGQIFSVTRERVRQIEAKAIRKLRQPYRSSILRDYVLASLSPNERNLNISNSTNLSNSQGNNVRPNSNRKVLRQKTSQLE